MIQTYMFSLGAIGTNAYLLLPEKGQGAWIVDAPEGVLAEITPILKKHGRKLEGVLLTHGHWDHMDELKKVRDAGAKVYAHADTRQLIEDPEGMQAPFMLPGARVESATVDVELKHGQVLPLDGVECRVFEVPGHCPGSLAFYFPQSKFVFTGDALFAGSVGRADLPGGDWDLLTQSIKNVLYALPDDVIVYPGHGNDTTIGDEKRLNPFVRG